MFILARGCFREETKPGAGTQSLLLLVQQWVKAKQFFEVDLQYLFSYGASLTWYIGGDRPHGEQLAGMCAMLDGCNKSKCPGPAQWRPLRHGLCPKGLQALQQLLQKLVHGAKAVVTTVTRQRLV